MMDLVLTHAKAIGKCSLALDESRLSLFGGLIKILYNHGWLALGVLSTGYMGIISAMIIMTKIIVRPELKAVSIAATVILTMDIAYAYYAIGMGTAVRLAAPFLGYHLSQMVPVCLLLTVILLFIIDKRTRENIAFTALKQ